MKIRIETSCLSTKKISGVANYTKLLVKALDNSPKAEIKAFHFNFCNRQPNPDIKLNKKLEKNNFMPLRMYSKLHSKNIAPPFDINLPKVDLTIFPNFATWPTIKSKLTATVIHDLTYLYFPEAVEEKNLKFLKQIIPRSIKKADFLITVSKSVKSEIVKEFSINPNRCIVTPIPPDDIFFKPNNNEIHKKYSIPTKKYIYFIGNLEPRKNLPVLIDAYCKLPQKIKSEYSLVMAGGNGWKTSKSSKSIEKAINNGENVIHIGYIDQSDSSALYQKASLFVMPSLYEGFGMPILEAMACQTPIIASDISVLRETGEDAVVYAKSNDSDDFCKKIMHILDNKKIINSLNKKASTRLNKISWQQNADIIIKYTQKILKEPK